jgi:hypothetical protein
MHPLSPQPYAKWQFKLIHKKTRFHFMSLLQLAPKIKNYQLLPEVMQ